MLFPCLRKTVLLKGTTPISRCSYLPVRLLHNSIQLLTLTIDLLLLLLHVEIQLEWSQLQFCSGSPEIKEKIGVNFQYPLQWMLFLIINYRLYSVNAHSFGIILQKLQVYRSEHHTLSFARNTNGGTEIKNKYAASKCDMWYKCYKVYIYNNRIATWFFLNEVNISQISKDPLKMQYNYSDFV